MEVCPAKNKISDYICSGVDVKKLYYFLSRSYSVLKNQLIPAAFLNLPSQASCLIILPLATDMIYLKRSKLVTTVLINICQPFTII